MKKGCLSSNALKMIAMSAMLLDHVGVKIIYQTYLKACVVEGVHMMGETIPAEAKRWYLCYLVLRSIGRIAFPVFAYLLVEGFLHTKNWMNYAKRLFLFAVVSEAAYDLPWSSDSLLSQNVLWTFLIGLVMLYHLRQDEWLEGRAKLQRIIRDVLAGMLAAFLIQSDYSAMGILFIAVLYLLRENKWKQAAAGCAVLGFMTVEAAVFSPEMWIQIFSIFSFGLLHFYNGERGRGNKYVFYVFYPLHLMILGLIARAS